MGMGIALLRFAVGGPAGMTDAAVALGTLLFHKSNKIFKFAFCLQANQLPCLHSCNSGGIVTAIFKLPQSIKQQWRSIPCAYYRNNAAHAVL